jgi:hypothetical protein
MTTREAEQAGTKDHATRGMEALSAFLTMHSGHLSAARRDNLRVHFEAVITAKDAEIARLRAEVEEARQMAADMFADRDRHAIERDAAVADNAALVKEAENALRLLLPPADIEPARAVLRTALKQPHPGAALLEQHRKALEVLNAIRTMPGIEAVLAPRDSLGSLLKQADELCGVLP